MMAGCVLLVAYVDLATGLWAAVASAVIAFLFWRVTEKRQQEALHREFTIPELEQAFDKMPFSLDASLPEHEIASLYPGSFRVHCSERIDGSWKGFPFTFANVVIEGENGLLMFRGQWLVVRTGWPDCVRVTIRSQEAGVAEKSPVSATALGIIDSDILEQYNIQSERKGDAETLLTDKRLQSVLRHA